MNVAGTITSRLRCSIVSGMPGANMTTMIPVATAIETTARRSSARVARVFSRSSSDRVSARLTGASSAPGAGRVRTS